MVGNLQFPVVELEKCIGIDGSWWTVNSEGRYHTTSSSPSSYSAGPERYQWKNNSRYHNESWKSYTSGTSGSDDYWDLNDEDLRGRLLLW